MYQKNLFICGRYSLVNYYVLTTQIVANLIDSIILVYREIAGFIFSVETKHYWRQ